MVKKIKKIRRSTPVVSAIGGHLHEEDTGDINHGKSLNDLLLELEDELGLVDSFEEEPTDEDLAEIENESRPKKRVIRVKGASKKLKVKSKLTKEPSEEPKTSSTPVKKSARPKDENTEVVTVKQLASIYEMEAKKVRKLLRGMFDSADGRWEWATDDPQLKIIHKALREKFGEIEVD